MKTSKTKALKLLNEKIKEFEKINENATYENHFDKDYNRVYYGTEALIAELFSEKDVMEFRRARGLRTRLP